MIVVGTAGHIDHGKTSLVRALTGIDTDRLPVEKARGITTELGFAHLDLDGKRLAVVDVPGHERFVKSMVAGAAGMDLVVLVIAADEGVMPQTREHLDICHLLGVRRGIVALSKIDMVDAEWRTMIEDDVRKVLSTTSLADSPIVGTSTKDPGSIEDLKRAIGKIVDELPPRAQGGVLRLPIDRIFTIKGFGTVVTGTMLGGEVAVGDELVVIPSGLATRVRGIEVHGAAVERAHAGHRVALNLGNVAVDDLARGDLLVHPGRVAASHILDVELAMLPSAPLRPTRSKVFLHHAASRTLATLHIVEGNVAQLRVDARTAIGALPGDRFILRDGPTIGGGTIVRVLAPKARGDDHADIVRSLAAARDAERVALEIKAASFAGLTLDDLTRRLGLDDLEPLVKSGDLLVAGPHYLHATAVTEIESRIRALKGVDREEVRSKLPPSLPRVAFDLIYDRVAVAKPVVRLAPEDDALLAKFLAWGVEPTRPAELPKASIDRLLAAKLLTKVKPDLLMHAEVVASIREKLLAHLDAHKTIDAQQWKTLVGASRKFTIPLAEYFDAEKVTLRVGDLRRRR